MQPSHVKTLGDYLQRIDPVCNYLGGTHDQWQISEMGDGNLNLVFYCYAS